MLKRATVLLLVVLLGSYAAPVSAQTLTEQEWTAQFTAELSNYASTHSEQETRAYAQYRLDQLTYSNLIPETSQTNLLEGGISPEVLYGEYTTGIYLDLDRDFNFDSKLRECTFRKQEQCRSTYNADLFTRLQFRQESLLLQCDYRAVWFPYMYRRGLCRTHADDSGGSRALPDLH